MAQCNNSTPFLNIELSLLFFKDFKNLISFISTACLYNLLHKRYDFGMELYYFILSCLSIDDKRNISEYNVIPRIKIKGEHKEVSLCKNLFNSIYSYKEIDCEFLDYNTFVNMTNINGGY